MSFWKPFDMVVHQSLEWQASHYSMNGNHAFMGVLKYWWSDSNLCLMVVIPPPPPKKYYDHYLTCLVSGLWSLVCPMTKHACNTSEDEIIHAYVQLLSNTIPNIKRLIINIDQREDHKFTSHLKGITFPCLQHEGGFIIRY